MYRLGLVDTLVTHANTNGVWPNFLVWSPPWLWCKTFGFFSIHSLKTKEEYISFAQFVYFLREVCLLVNF